MKTYLVGGAVRDKLLGRPVHEKDWLVVGSSPEEMIQQGFIPVGKAFPVFLHPNTKEEYALARTERKVAPGYHGFTFHADKTVTLKEDLARRDLTINALAEDEDGHVIDYYNGLTDLKQKMLRHVTSAFSEDPVRVLRIARFAARYHSLGFKIAPETITLMQHMAKSGELSHLVAERVWAEWEKSLGESTPGVFLQTLFQAQVLTAIFPIFSNEKTLLNACAQLDKIALKEKNTTLRFALFMQFILSAKTADTIVSSLIKTYKIPNHYSDYTQGLSALLPVYNKVDFITAEPILELYETLDANRRLSRALDLLHAAGLFTGEEEKTNRLQQICQQLHDLKWAIPDGLTGPAISHYIRQKRLAAVQHYLVS